MAYRAAARSPPATVCTFSCSTRSRTFVRAPVGSGSESATITRTSRPATLWPTSSQNRLKPSVMSLPIWEKLPVSGPKYPIRMGPRSAARGSRGRPARPSAAAPIATRNARLRMSPSFSGSLAPMLVATRDKILPTTMTGSYPRPQWFTEGLRGRAFKDALGAGPLDYASLWKVAQRFTDRPVKFGAISAQTLAKMLVNKHYASERELILDLADIFNAELRAVARAGCRVIQVEEPRHHISGADGSATDRDLQFFTDAINREIKGVETEVWLHTCWGNPNQQPLHWERPSYERALPHLLQTNADVITLECASTGGKDLALLGKHRTDKKVALGVVSHTSTAVEPPEVVAHLIRKALEHLPPERLILSTDCGFGREGLARRIAFYKCVAINLGANIVRRELKLPEIPIPAADPRFTLAG